MSDFQTYCDTVRTGNTKKDGTVKIPSSIRERWNTRIISRQLNTKGAAGAIMYLNDYGKGISADKVTALALVAEDEGCHEMAYGFWAKAYNLATGNYAPGRSEENPRPQQAGSAYRGILPSHLRPGRLITMQPVDAPHDREYYINNDDYIGQPKRDGNRLVIIVDEGSPHISGDAVFFQSRSTNLRAAPDLDMEKALAALGRKFGPFVLDGELYYPDYQGKEHRTGAQAATVNIQKGFGDFPTFPRYAVFKALFSNGRDLTGDTELERISAGARITKLLTQMLPENFEFLTPAVTTAEKSRLAFNQQMEGREGEVWIRTSCRYVGGKDHKSEAIVRTKYLEEFIAVVTGLTATDKDRPFGAIKISTTDRIPRGHVGTGFTQEDMNLVARRFAEANATGHVLLIKIVSQGFTEGGQAWHARYDGIVE